MADPKSGRKRVCFGDLVTSAGATRKARGWTAADAAVERYVGLEHLDANSPTIRRWGSPETVGENSDLRPFEVGDVILARRGIEQRKVGRAEFRGVASGHALVFRARPEVLVPEFLPHFLLSDTFMKRALQFSAGSLSKTVNLSALLRQEFELPRLADQRRIADELNALQTARDDAHEARRAGEQFLEVLTWNLCTGKSVPGPRRETADWEHGRLPGVSSIPRDWSITRLTDVARLESGHTPSRSKPEYWHGGIPWISLADIRRLGKPEISETDEDIAQLGIENSSARLLPAGTVVLSRTAMIGFTSVITRPMTTSQDFADFVCGHALNPKFLFWLFMGMKEFFDYTAIGSSNVKTIYMPFFQNMQIALPPRAVQDEIVEQLGAVRAQVDALRAREGDHARFTAALRESRIGGAS